MEKVVIHSAVLDTLACAHSAVSVSCNALLPNLSSWQEGLGLSIRSPRTILSALLALSRHSQSILQVERDIKLICLHIHLDDMSLYFVSFTALCVVYTHTHVIYSQAFVSVACMRAQSLHKINLTLWNPWTIAHQAPISQDFQAQEYWEESHFTSQVIFLTQGI